MEKALIKFLDTAPSAMLTIGIIFLIVYLLREYRKIRTETEESVKNLVNAKLGEVMTSIQTEISRLELVAKEQESKIVKIEDNYLLFLQDIEVKSEQIESLFKEANDKLIALKEAIPNVDEYSARDILALAQSRESSQSKAELCSKILVHSDATSKDLELAGDMMEKGNRYTLALQLYQSAHEKDPERLGAFSEYMSLQAIILPNKREESLTAVKKRVLEAPNRNCFASVANALMELDRYEELSSFSLDFLEVIKNRDPKLRALAFRNVAVANKEIGEIDEAIIYFERAFALSPEDANILKPYLGILEEQGKIDEHVATAEKLVIADPSDIQYYRILISSLIKAHRYSDALDYIAKAREIPMSQMDEVVLNKYEKRADMAKANKKINSDHK